MLFSFQFASPGTSLTIHHTSISTFGGSGYSVIVSNPPYIPTATYVGLDRNVLSHEDRLALDGGGDGLAVTRLILDYCANRNGRECVLHMELDEGQPEKVLEMAEMYRGFKGGRGWKDDFGKERMVEVEWSGEVGVI